MASRNASANTDGNSLISDASQSIIFEEISAFWVSLKKVVSFPDTVALESE